MQPFAINKMLGDVLGVLGERLFRMRRARDLEARVKAIEGTASVRMSTPIADPMVTIDLPPICEGD